MCARYRGRKAGQSVNRHLHQAHHSLLLGDHDATRAGRLAHELSARGFDPTLAFDSTRFFDLLDARHFDLVAVASSLVESDDRKSAEFLRSLRERSDAPLLAIAESGSVADLLDRGVEAVVPGGATMREVGAAARALLRLRSDAMPRERMSWGALALDGARRSATWRGEPISLTKLQFRLLVALVSAQGAVVTREELNRALYGSAPADDGERIMAHVRRVREKIEDDSAHPRFLLTVRGEGFRLADGHVGGRSRARGLTA
jgi:two-component system, OmpR family, response regulator MtrA